MINTDELKAYIETNFPDFKLEVKQYDDWELCYVPFANDLKFIGDVLLKKSGNDLIFYEILDVRFTEGTYLIMPFQSRTMDCSEVNNVLLELSLTFAAANYNQAKIKYRLMKEKFKMDSLSEDFE